LLDEAVDRVVDVRSLGEGLEVAGIEALADHRGLGQDLTQVRGQALDALLDDLLDRRRHGLG
jgi:hypothetical protein